MAYGVKCKQTSFRFCSYLFLDSPIIVTGDTESCFLSDRSGIQVVLCCCRPYTSSFSMFCIMRCFSAQPGCKECLFIVTVAFLWPINQSSHSPLIKKVFLPNHRMFFVFCLGFTVIQNEGQFTRTFHGQIVVWQWYLLQIPSCIIMSLCWKVCAGDSHCPCWLSVVHRST